MWRWRSCSVLRSRRPHDPVQQMEARMRRDRRGRFLPAGRRAKSRRARRTGCGLEPDEPRARTRLRPAGGAPTTTSRSSWPTCRTSCARRSTPIIGFSEALKDRHVRRAQRRSRQSNARHPCLRASPALPDQRHSGLVQDRGGTHGVACVASSTFPRRSTMRVAFVRERASAQCVDA